MTVYHYSEYPGNDVMDSIALTHGTAIYMEHPSNAPIIVTSKEEADTYKAEGYRTKGVINLADFLGSIGFSE